MQAAGEAHDVAERELSLLDLLQWMARQWWLILCGGLVGLLLGLIYHLASEERYVVRLEMAITDSPLGAASFVRDISTNFLRRQAGTAVAVEFNQRTSRLSLIERGVPRNAIAVRRAAMQNAVMALRTFLDDLVAKEYARMQERFMAMEPSPEAYAELARFRLYLSALEDGLLESVVVVSESVRLRGPALGVLLSLGVVAGMGLGTAVAFAAELLRARRRAGRG